MLRVEGDCRSVGWGAGVHPVAAARTAAVTAAQTEQDFGRIHPPDMASDP